MFGERKVGDDIVRGECILGVVFLVLSLISNLFAQETIIDNGDAEYSQIGFETIDDSKSYQGDVAVAFSY